MTQEGSRKLREYCSELQSIITALRQTEETVRSAGKNIGSDRCADCIDSVIEKYESALRTLQSVDGAALDRVQTAAE